jgi:hypothetical protein
VSIVIEDARVRGASSKRLPTFELPIETDSSDLRDDADRERDFICGSALPPLQPADVRGLGALGRIRQRGQCRSPLLDGLCPVVGDGIAQRIIGVARYAASSAVRPEFAIAVADQWQSRGVGTATRVDCSTMRANKAFITSRADIGDELRMLGLAHGWLRIDTSPDEFRVLDARLELSTKQDRMQIQINTDHASTATVGGCISSCDR